MHIYTTLAGALVIGSMLLIGSGVVFLFTQTGRALANARRRAVSPHAVASALGLVLFIAASIAFGHYSFDRAFDTSRAFVPGDEIRWEPAGELPTTSFDRFDYGSASNAEIAHRR